MTYIWFTLNTETSRLTPRTMKELTKIVYAIRLHATALWGVDKDDSIRFEISKIDVAIDMKGSFMKDDNSEAYDNIKSKLQNSVS